MNAVPARAAPDASQLNHELAGLEMKFSAATIIAFAVSMTFSAHVYACSCVCQQRSLEESTDEADAIFVGTIDDQRRASSGRDFGDDLVVVSSCGSLLVELSVDKVLKGELPARATFVRGAIGTECDFDFSLTEGRTYLFYGYQSDSSEEWHLSGCSPSLPIESADEVVETIRSHLAAAS